MTQTCFLVDVHAAHITDSTVTTRQENGIGGSVEANQAHVVFSILFLLFTFGCLLEIIFVAFFPFALAGNMVQRVDLTEFFGVGVVH